MIRDVIDEFFEKHNTNFDLKELMKTNLLGNENQGELPGDISQTIPSS